MTDNKQELPPITHLIHYCTADGQEGTAEMGFPDGFAAGNYQWVKAWLSEKHGMPCRIAGVTALDAARPSIDLGRLAEHLKEMAGRVNLVRGSMGTGSPNDRALDLVATELTVIAEALR